MFNPADTATHTTYLSAPRTLTLLPTYLSCPQA